MANRDISERHEIRVESEKATFVFLADSAEGKLMIRQIRKSGQDREVCALTLGDPRELEDFFEGLHRVLESMDAPKLAREARPPSRTRTRTRTRPRAVPASKQETLPLVAGAPAAMDEEDRERLVERARARNAKAFEPWSKQEEQEIRARFRTGEPVDEIARSTGRSPRAILIRLRRLGEAVDGGQPSLLQ